MKKQFAILLPIVLALSLSSAFGGGQKIRSEFDKADWWAERAAVFFPKNELTLFSTNPSLQRSGSDGRALRIVSPNSAAPDLYWRTDGTPGTWAGAGNNNWSNPASPTGGTAWASGDDAFFTADSTLTFATSTVSDVTVADGITVTVTKGGSLTLGGVRTFDIGTGSTLTWTSQNQSVGPGNEGAGIIKNGAGTLDWGAGPGANVRYNGGFTLNAGTLIVSGDNALSSGMMTFNGGTLQSSGSHTYTSSSIVIGGDFAFAGTGDDVWNQPSMLVLLTEP